MCARVSDKRKRDQQRLALPAAPPLIQPLAAATLAQSVSTQAVQQGVVINLIAACATGDITFSPNACCIHSVLLIARNFLFFYPSHVIQKIQRKNDIK